MSDNLTKQFKKLRETGPSLEWTKNTRNFLIAKIQQDSLTNKPSLSTKLQLLCTVWLKGLVPSSVRVISTLVVLSLIGGTGLAAQAEYIPTRPLYTVKRTIEKIELVLAFTAKGEARVHLKHATERQEEALKLAQKANLTTEQKEEGISMVIRSMEKEINAAQSSLQIVQKSQNQPEKTAKLAKEITNNIKEGIETLDKIKETASSTEMNQAVSEVKTAIEQIENASLELLIKEAEKQENQQSVISTEELKLIVYNKIQRTNVGIQGLYKVIEGINPDIKVVKEETRAGTAEVKVYFNIKAVIDEAVDKLILAQEALDEADAVLEKGMLTDALKKIKKSSEIIKEAQEILDQITDLPAEATETPAPSPNNKESAVEGIYEEAQIFDSASTTSETTPNVIEQILNYAPLGGKVNQTASYTGEIIDENLDK